MPSHPRPAAVSGPHPLLAAAVWTLLGCGEASKLLLRLRRQGQPDQLGARRWSWAYLCGGPGRVSWPGVPAVPGGAVRPGLLALERPRHLAPRSASRWSSWRWITPSSSSFTADAAPVDVRRSSTHGPGQPLLSYVLIYFAWSRSITPDLPPQVPPARPSAPVGGAPRDASCSSSRRRNCTRHFPVQHAARRRRAGPQDADAAERLLARLGDLCG